jgi:ribosomal-protein-alanine N-acetyltransferase
VQAGAKAQPVLKTERLVLRLAVPDDVPEILSFYGRNDEFFRATDPARPQGFDTERFWLEQVEKSLTEFYRDTSVRLLLFDARSRVLGTAYFTQIFRGPFHACYLGYGLDQAEQGKGLMTEALTAAIAYMFDELGLHRIMANYMPHNAKSAAVLKRLGFVIEGQARDYLRINGAWRDHVLTSLINPGWTDPARPR